jgi:toxin ParE1/3/4
MNVAILPAAELEAAEAAAWYDDQRLGLGDDFLDELQKALARAQSQTDACSVLEDFPGPDLVQRCLLRRFPYMAIFLCRSDEILVVAICHVRRRPFYWLDRI